MMVIIKNTRLFVTLHLKILYNCNSKQLMMGKKKFAKICVLLLLMLTTAVDLYAQDPQFSQFYANPIYLNPAFAGTARCPRVVLNYRNQWPGIPGNFVTYSASYDQHVDKINGGFGLQVMNDRAGSGALTTTGVSGIYSYQFSVSRQFSIRAGVQATYYQKKVDWNSLTFGDQINDRNGFIYKTQETPILNSRSVVDFSAGVLAFSDKFFGGVAVAHLTQPYEGFTNAAKSRLPRKITVHAGAVIPISQLNDWTISPNIIYQQQANFQQLNLGLYVTKGPIVGGLWYRNQDAVIALIGIKTEKFKIGYTYDVTISKLSNASAGAHEVSVIFNFKCKVKRKKFNTINCPTF
jgi:type IX secretion system PorP/SprF family membrane protein